MGEIGTGSGYAAAIPKFTQAAVDNGAPTVFGDGLQTRDFIYVKDIVGALSFAAETPGVTGVFNAGTLMMRPWEAVAFASRLTCGQRTARVDEIHLRAQRAIAGNDTNRKIGLTFVPHLVPMIRGIHATLYARLGNRDVDLQALFEQRYAGDE